MAPLGAPIGALGADEMGEGLARRAVARGGGEALAEDGLGCPISGIETPE